MKRPEEQIQRAVVSHLKARSMPGVFFFHPANGGRRTKAEAGIFKALGVRAGVPDLIVVYRAQIFGLELKADSGRLTPIQRQALNDMEVAGARTAVAHSLDEALVTLECWACCVGTGTAVSQHRRESMSDVTIGHNSATAVAADQLRSIIERIERLEEDKKAISDDIKDVYAEAKGNGYNPKALRVVVQRRKADARKLAELEADTAAYMAALGMLP